MNILDFAGEVIFLSASGVLSPGPLFLVNLICGTKQGYRAGIKIATGHAIIELPLIIILTISFFQLVNITVNTYGLNILGLLGGISIITFSVIQITNTSLIHPVYTVVWQIHDCKVGNVARLSRLKWNWINPSYLARVSL